MAFRRKYQAVLELDPDILVIPESESPAFLRAKKAEMPWPNHIWFGDNPAKGLSVISKKKFSLKLKETHNTDFRFVLPVKVAHGSESFELFAVWTQGEKQLSKAYVTHIANAVDFYLPNLKPDTIILGDFNSSSVFKQNGAKHVKLIETLDKTGFQSLYHRQNGQEHGDETDPTFYLHRHLNKPYHLDYIMCHETKLGWISVGNINDFIGLSDHMPLIADF